MAVHCYAISTRVLSDAARSATFPPGGHTELHDVTGLSHEDAAAAVNADLLHVLVDLNGYTLHSQVRLFVSPLSLSLSLSFSLSFSPLFEPNLQAID